ncbi:MAG: phytanoyl-CoA dioxygenase, partial [Rhodospirillaceae bacterium]
MSEDRVASISRSDLPVMRELTVSNHLLGDRKALDVAWERDGYWFFRDVLDKNAVTRFRSVYIELLAEHGVVTADDPYARYTGASLETFPFRMEPLVARQPWKPFVAEKPVHDFFTYLLGDEPFWVPTVEYRAVPPADDHNRSPFDF